MTSTRPVDVATRFKTIVEELTVDPLPLPGSGQTADRLHRLAQIARTSSVSLARLVEAHTDAVAILSEAGRQPIAGALYGVWASQLPGRAVAYDSGRQQVTGHMPFASGLGIVDRSLCTVQTTVGDPLLLDLEVSAGPSLHPSTRGWQAVGLQATATGSVDFVAHPTCSDAVVAEGNWYLSRPGFWHGACAPAACWAGAALGLLDYAECQVSDDPHRLAYLGAMRTAEFTLLALIDRAGNGIDENASDATLARYRAVAFRSAVERCATSLADYFSQSLGPRPQVQHRAVDQRLADLQLYMRQHHGNRDLAALGGLVL